MAFKELLEQKLIFKTIGQCADELGIDAYLVGGFVRDMILSRSSTDIDVVCIGSGMELAKRVAKKLGKGTDYAEFKNFGTAQVKNKEVVVEFVGARKESYRRDSRKPIVEDGTLEEDLSRRDFTINALAVGLSKNVFGQLIDLFDGEKHIHQKIIKTPLDPGITFSDDPLRMMRGIRFASQLNFDIEPDTFQAILDHKERLEIVSMERISEELNKLILSPKPSYGFKLLFHAGLMSYILPEFIRLKGVDSIEGKSHKDNFYHTLQVLDNLSNYSNDLWLRWSAVLHDIAKPQTKKYYPGQGWTFHGHEEKGAKMVPHIFKRLKLPLNDRMKMVQKLVRLHLRPIALVKKEITDSAIRRLIFEAGDDIDNLMMLCRADITTKDSNKVDKYLKNFDFLEKRIAEVEESDKLRNFQPVITGEIIMETFEIKPSKEVGEIKEQIKEAILEGIIKNNYSEAFPFMVEVGKRLGLNPTNSNSNTKCI